ncbi:MAG: hypothetical protein QOI73_663 [Solirubrobacteraceae bacterium]|nr:hypothetical protein [Solirubrobacteraceae bacterium]
MLGRSPWDWRGAARGVRWIAIIAASDGGHYQRRRGRLAGLLQTPRGYAAAGASGPTLPALSGLEGAITAASISAADTLSGWWQAARWPLA